jgi:hypothetical protein
MNSHGVLGGRIRIDEVLGALYCQGVPTAMVILRDLQGLGKRMPDPTGYIQARVTISNGGTADLPEAIANIASAEPMEEAEEDEADKLLKEMERENKLISAELNLDEPDDDVDIEAILAGSDAKDKQEELSDPLAPAKGSKRVVGSVHGLKKLTSAPIASRPAEVPRAKEMQPASGPSAAMMASVQTARPTLGISPQEKLVQVREFVMKAGLNLDPPALQALARLPFYRAKDLVEEVLLGGFNRKGVRNPSQYIARGCARLATGLGVEQGIAMEMACGIGVCLNSDALDELASIPRKESHAIIRELAKNQEAQSEPLVFIRDEVHKIRAALDARPFPFKKGFGFSAPSST